MFESPELGFWAGGPYLPSFPVARNRFLFSLDSDHRCSSSLMARSRSVASLLANVSHSLGTAAVVLNLSAGIPDPSWSNFHMLLLPCTADRAVSVTLFNSFSSSLAWFINACKAATFLGKLPLTLLPPFGRYWYVQSIVGDLGKTRHIFWWALGVYRLQDRADDIVQLVTIDIDVSFADWVPLILRNRM